MPGSTQLSSLPPVTGTSHPNYKQLEDFAADRLSSADRTQVANHLELCHRCRADAAEALLFRRAIKPPHIRILTRGRVAAAALVAITIGYFVFSGMRNADAAADQILAYARLVDRTVTENNIDVPAGILSLRGTTLDVRTEQVRRFRLNSPLATAVLVTRPEFSWESLGERARYTVSVFDQNLDRIDHSSALAETRWRPTMRLEAGRVYEWQVRAEVDGLTMISPGPEGPRARFAILSEAAMADFKRAQRIAPLDHLLLGILSAKAGALDEAESELSAAGARGSRLFLYLRSLRR